jgi:hypothetical protein
MDLEKVLAQLREEVADLDAAIQSLERLQEVSGANRRYRKSRVQPGQREAALPEPTGQVGPAPGSSLPRQKGV